MALVVAFAQGTNFTNPVTRAVNVGSTAGRCMYVQLGRIGSGLPIPDTVTIGGTDTLTARGAEWTDLDGNRQRVFAGPLTVTGSQTISGAYTADPIGDAANGFATMVGVVWDGVGAAVIESLQTGAQYNTTPSFTVASRTGDTVIAFLVEYGSGVARTITPSSPATALSGDGLASNYAVLQEAGAASVTIDGTWSGSAGWVGCAFNIPAGSGGGDTTAPTITGPTGDPGDAEIDVDIDTGDTLVGTFTADEDVTWSISGGADAADFELDSVLDDSVDLVASAPLAAGTYEVELSAEDAAENVATMTVNITVSDPNAPPEWTGSAPNRTAKRGQAITTIDLSALTSDPEGDTRSYSLSGAPTGVTVNSSTGIVSGTPTAAPGVYTVTPSVSDGINSPVAGATFTITVQQCVLALNQEAYAFGDGNSAATMARVASTELQVAAYPLTEWPPAAAVASVTATTGSNGRLADLGDDDLTFGTTYRCIARNAADGETWAWTMAAS